MNIGLHLPKITPLYNANNENRPLYNKSYFNLKMVQPLNADTVSFGIQRTVKKGNLQNMITKDAAADIINEMKKPHEKFKEFLEEEFSDIISDKYGKKLATLEDRIKGIFSTQLKTGSRDWKKKKDVLNYMTDLSGFTFVLEDRRAFTECMNRFIKLIKQGKVIIPQAEEINAEEIRGLPVEYHVIPPLYKRGKIVEEYSPLPMQKLQELKKTLIDVYHPATKMSDTVDSVSGYSGLHVIAKIHGGHYAEIKFLTRAMADVQRIENLLYKIRNGKPIDPNYTYLEPYLKDLKPLSEYATEKEIKEHEKLTKAIEKYTLEVYKDALNHPFEKDAPMPKPKDPLIAKYDFNIIKTLMEDDFAEKLKYFLQTLGEGADLDSLLARILPKRRKS